MADHNSRFRLNFARFTRVALDILMGNYASERYLEKLEQCVKVFAVFFFGGMFVCVALTMIFSIASGIAKGEIMFAVIISPFLGIYTLIFGMFLSILTGAMCAVIAVILFGRTPLWFLIAALPLCGLVANLQHPFAMDPAGLPDNVEPSPDSLFATVMAMSVLQLPITLACWYWARRMSKRPTAAGAGT